MGFSLDFIRSEKVELKYIYIYIYIVKLIFLFETSTTAVDPRHLKVEVAD